MDRDSIIRKVQTCLRMAKSSNSNEAAAALRQARAMMAKYGLDAGTVEAASFRQAHAKTRQRGAMVPSSVAHLARVIAAGFRCLYIIEPDPISQSTRINFHGAPNDVEVAAYAFLVMRRQMDKDRLQHIKRVRKNANRKTRGEWFARAWVLAVAQLFPPAELGDEHRRSLTASFDRQYPEQVKASTRNPAMGKADKTAINDIDAGLKAGLSARFHRGVKGSGQACLGHTKP